MKLSLRWIFDHLEGSYSAYSADEIVKKLIISTAEIEHYSVITYPIGDVTFAQVTHIDDKQVELFSPECDKKYTIPIRKDAVMGQWYLINHRTHAWVTLREWHTDKDGLLPAFSVTTDESKGSWKKNFEKDDVILEVDNKSITNRPDLWGHRGFAREISVLLNIPLKKGSSLLKKVPLLTAPYADSSCHNLFNVEIVTPSCSHIAIIPIKCSTIPASIITMATRLCRADLKPMNAIVDVANYVMADMGHPMHAFDADVFPAKKLIVRNAHVQENLTLLDGTILNLTPADMVVANDTQALSLAGIKGGLQSGVSATTKNILLEAGCFDATTVRLSSARHKLRTDASARFEKTLDNQGNVKALERFLALCDQYKIAYSLEGCLLVTGPKPEIYSVTLAHKAIEDRIGMALSLEKITGILTSLGMQVTVQHDTEHVSYKVEIPSFRSSKDVRIKEDVVEEIARIIGYDSINPVLPSCASQPHLHQALYNSRKIKQYLAHTMQLSEVENYALFDNNFIKKIGYEPEETLVLKNPLTEERTTLVTSLIPHLMQNVLQEYEHHESIGFFEWARVFNNRKDVIEEHKVLAGIIYNKKSVDFYAVKQHIEALCVVVGHSVVWQENKKKPWWSNSYKVVDAYASGHYIGTMGQLSEQLTAEFTKGQSICFEFYLDPLLHTKAVIKKAQPLPTHQVQSLDVSCMIHQSVTTDQLITVIKNTDPRVIKVTLIDSYHKNEWKERKSMTFRCSIYGVENVLSKEALEEMLHHINTALEGHGAEVR